MLHSLEESRDWQSDMQLAGKLVLSAAALLLVTLAYRFYKSRSPGHPSRSGITGQEVRGLEGECPARAPLKEDSTDSVPGLRNRQRANNGVRQSCNVTDYQTDHLSGTVTIETWGPHGKVHQGDQNLLSKEEECETGEATSTFQKNKKQAAEERQAEIPTESQQPELVDTVIPFNEEGKYNVGVKENHVNLDDFESKNSKDLQAGSLEHSNQRGEVSNYKPVSKKCELSPACNDCPKPHDDPQGEEMIKSSLLIQESQVSLDSLQTVNARSGIDLQINQAHEKSDRLHTFSSTTEIKVEENYIKDKHSEDDNLTHSSSPAGLKTKTYNYYVSSTSESLSKERSNTVGASDLCPSPKELLDSESGLSPFQELGKRDHVKGFVTTQVLTTNGPSHESEEMWKPEALVGMPQGFSGALQNQEFHKTENFMKPEVKTELPVKVQDFSTSTPDGTNLWSLPANELTVQSLYSTDTDSNTELSLETIINNNFFQINKGPDLAIAKQLNLGNCYDMLCAAKKHKLYDLQEAAYKFMSDHYLQVLQNPSIYRHLNATERDLILERRMKGRKFVTVADVDPQDYNLPPSQNPSRLCFYDDENDSWHMLSYIPTEAISTGCAMGTMFNYLFVVAGCEDQGSQKKPSNRVFCYNPLTDNWREVSPLNLARPHCKLVALDGYLYAIGGECQYTMERYDPCQDRWTFTAPMPNDTFAVAHTATACDNEICVTGGTLRYLMIKYNSKHDSWKINFISGSKDRTTEIVSVNHFIYRFDLNRSMGISVYRCSTSAKLWYECATNRMPYPTPFQCAVINPKIYCISRKFTLSFLADEVSPRFLDENLKAFPSPKGNLFPFVLILPNRDEILTGS
ncbi:kelch domain-containing protein 7A [Microcaecilia unicolor]|uniref:Kelch domain-containing protein 7A n=1 Tax=Microcaecilia unicolor TaxID=1415580 RepID=A0A6P7ZYA3_9AMPH|nr:kelch domain-containing protein 7A [Microcaecilia unicolor]